MRVLAIAFTLLSLSTPGLADINLGASVSTAGVGLELGYRHNSAVNTVFFDGHGETMQPDEAKDINRWFPTGSIVMVAAVTADPNDQNNDKIR